VNPVFSHSEDSLPPTADITHGSHNRQLKLGKPVEAAKWRPSG
jgi:hypothetical protein